ncbi:13242_t:CDS:2, partial [Cetraspora pellucida]
YVDPLCWWQTQQSEFPILSIIAHDYLSIQATSIASKQAFSIAEMVILDERNKLEKETSKAILCLKTWICKEFFYIDLYRTSILSSFGSIFNALSKSSDRRCD